MIEHSADSSPDSGTKKPPGVEKPIETNNTNKKKSDVGIPSPDTGNPSTY